MGTLEEKAEIVSTEEEHTAPAWTESVGHDVLPRDTQRTNLICPGFGGEGLKEGHSSKSETLLKPERLKACFPGQSENCHQACR